jgi:hypothetical protein
MVVSTTTTTLLLLLLLFHDDYGNELDDQARGQYIVVY